jgi:hypothetical protein
MSNTDSPTTTLIRTAEIGSNGDGDLLDGTLAIHRAAIRLRSVDATVPGCDPRSPFLSLWESARVVAATTHLTVWLRWGGAADRRLTAHLLLSSVDIDASELDALVRVTLAMFDAPRSPWHVEAVDPEELDLPSSGDVRFIRQTRATVPVGPGASVDLPLRFSFPGPGAWDRMLAALAAVEQRLDLAVTVTPTALTPDEESELADLTALRFDESTDRSASRVWATLADAAASYRTDPALVQVVLVGSEGLADSEVGAIASTLTASFDTTNGEGYRVAASPQRFIGGGYDVDPARTPIEVLECLRIGRPWIGSTDRTLSDLVTCDELSFLLAWPLSSRGDLPGVPSGSGLEDIDQAVAGVDPTDAVSLGELPDGRHLLVGVRDRTQHVAVLGASGCGKSTLLLHLAQQDVLDGRTTWVLDSSGDLLHRLAAAVPEDRRDRVIVLDAVDVDRSQRIDLLRPSADPGRRLAFVEAIHDGLVADLNKDFHGPMGQTNLLAVMRLVAYSDLPLWKVPKFISDRGLATGLCAQALKSDWPLSDEIETVRLMGAGGETENAELFRWLRSKAAVLGNDGIRDVFCGEQPTVEIEEMLQPGAIVLIRTPSDAGACHLITSVLLEVLATATFGRSLDDHPIALYLEEVQRAAGRALRHVLNESRKRNICCHLATQHLRNLEDEAEGVLTNASTILCGRSRGHSGRMLESDLDLPESSLRSLPNLSFLGSTAINGTQVGPVRVSVGPMSASPTGWPSWLAGVQGGSTLSPLRANRPSGS